MVRSETNNKVLLTPELESKNEVEQNELIEGMDSGLYVYSLYYFHAHATENRVSSYVYTNSYSYIYIWNCLQNLRLFS